MQMPNFKLWLKRSTLFKIISIAQVLILACIMISISIVLMNLYQQIEPRSLQYNNHNIRLKVQNLSELERSKIEKHMPGIPIHNIESSLSLVGLAYDTNQSDIKSNLQLELGIFPQYRAKVMRNDSRFKLQFRAPSFLLLLQDITRSPQGQKLKGEAFNFLKTLKQKISEIWPILEKSMKKHLAPYIAKMKTDPKLKNILKRSIQKQFLSQINWEAMIQDTFKSSEVTNIQAQLFKDLNIWSVARSTITESMKETWRLPSSFTGWSWSHPIDSWKTMRKKRLENQEKVKQKALQTIGRTVGTQVLDNAKQHKTDLIQSTQMVIVEQNQKYKVSTRAQKWFESLLVNQNLKQHISSTYGAEVWKKLQIMLREIAREPKVQNLYEEMSIRFKDLVEKTLQLVLLDKANQGPNPLLLLVIQERIKGHINPIIHVEFGQGEVVPEAYEFEINIHP